MTLRKSVLFGVLLAIPVVCNALKTPDPAKASNITTARFSLNEVAREAYPSGEKVTYSLNAFGLPKGKHYILWLHSVSQGWNPISTGWMTDQQGEISCLAKPGLKTGLAMCQGRLSDQKVAFDEFKKGEPFQFALTSEDGQFQIFAKVFPSPLEAIDGTCRISGEIQSVNMLIFSGSGFRPMEKIRTLSQSGRETISQDLVADSRGRFSKMVLPGVEGKTGGKASLKIIGNTCSPQLDYEWGIQN